MQSNRVNPRDIARILALIADPPNPRAVPRAGDLEGDFDEWLDGGAIRFHTGHTNYYLQDGTEIVVGGAPPLAISIQLASGERVRTVQEHSVPLPRPVPSMPVPPRAVRPTPWHGLPECLRTGDDFRHCSHCGARSEHAVAGPDAVAFTCRRCQERTVPPDPRDTLHICGACGCSHNPGRFCPWCGQSTEARTV